MYTINFKDYFPILVLLVLIVLSYLILKPFLAAILLGALLAYIFYPLYSFLLRKLKNKTLVAILICFLVLLILIIPTFFLAKVLIKESYFLYLTGKQVLSSNFWESCTNPFCSLIQDPATNPEVQSQIQDLLKTGTSWIIKKSSDFLIKLPQLMLNLFVMFFTLFYFLKEGDGLVKKLSNYFITEKYSFLHQKIKNIVHAIIYGYLLIALLQGILGALGFYLFGLGSPLFWGIIMAFLALMPYLGTWFVWLPAVLYLIISGIIQDSNILIYKGIGLFFYCLILVSSIDNFLQPKIISTKAKVHPTIILLGTLGGFFLLGLSGLIIGPVILSVTLILVEGRLSAKNH